MGDGAGQRGDALPDEHHVWVTVEGGEAGAAASQALVRGHCRYATRSAGVWRGSWLRACCTRSVGRRRGSARERTGDCRRYRVLREQGGQR